MKAISLTQPWASLVAIGAKRIETRSWRTSHRGLLAIHAAKGFPNDAKDLCSAQPFLRELTRAGLSMPELPRGAIVSVARVRDVYATEHLVRAGLSYPEREFGDYTIGRFGWCFEDVRRLLQPIPCKGALGLWEVPTAIYQAIAQQLELAPVQMEG